MPWSPRVAIYSHTVDLAWMQQQLTRYYVLIERGPEDSFLDIVDDPARVEVLRMEPTVREILERLDPALADGGIDPFGNWAETFDAVNSALGILAAREACETKLAPDIPVLSADQFHPWVWRAARTLWDSAHYRHAVQAAATAINDHTQNKLSRRDIADTQLMQEAFSPHPPEPGRPRLRCPGDPGSPTNQSRQRGALQYAAGCFSAIRNPATHEQGEWDQETALECLAALSLLARWIDGWALDKAP
jgi:uncharacterized protein (TIGR02391 family)